MVGFEPSTLFYAIFLIIYHLTKEYNFPRFVLFSSLDSLYTVKIFLNNSCSIIFKKSFLLKVEKAKRALSVQHQVKMEVESLIDGIDFSETLTRAKFENLNMDLFRGTLKPVQKVLEDAGFLGGIFEKF